MTRVRWLPPPAFPALAFLAALGSGSIGLGQPSYWFDEAASLSVATRSLTQQWQLAAHIDVVHAVYNAVLSGWITLFGTGEVATRSLSLIAFSLAAAGFAVFTSRIASLRVAMASTGVFIVLPGIAWAGGEARGYALTLMVVVWNLVLLEALLTARCPARSRRSRVFGWILYALLIALTIHLSLVAALTVFGHFVLLRALRPQSTGAWLASWLSATVVSVPLLMRAAMQSEQVAWIDHSFVTTASKVALGQLFWGPRFNQGVSLEMVSAVLLMLVGASLAFVAVLRVRSVAVWFGITSFAAPTLLLAGLAVAGVPLYEERYLLFAAPGFCLLVAEGIFALRAKAINNVSHHQRGIPATALASASVSLPAAMLVAILAFSIPQLAASRGELAKSGDNYRGLALAASKSDVVIFADVMARGVQIAYPNLVRGKDLMLASSPQASATLWGENIDTEAFHDSSDLTGTVSVFTTTEFLSEECVREATGLVATRFTVTNMWCDPALGSVDD